jgi:hypothetical protein
VVPVVPSGVKSQRAWAASAVVTRMCGALKGLDRGLKFVRQHAASAITRHSPTVNCLHAELVVLLAVINVRRGKGEGGRGEASMCCDVASESSPSLLTTVSVC